MKVKQISECRYAYCHDCKCEHFGLPNRLYNLTLKSTVNERLYIMTVSFVNNKSQLTEHIPKHSNDAIIYTYNGIAAVTPQNIESKIKMWLLMY